mgnify:CR=1 FL=1
MLEELRKAEKYIFLEYFIISPGIFWDSMVEILKEKHAAGVDVRVIYDDVGSLNTLPMNYARKFEAETGIPCCCFNRFKPVISIRMTTGTTGSSVLSTATPPLPAASIWPTSISTKSCGMATGRTRHSPQGGGGVEHDRHVPDHVGVHPGRGGGLPPLPAGQAAAGGRAGSGVLCPAYADNPLDEEAVGEAVYLNLINKAERYVYAMTPYLIISDSVNTALCNAAKSGVDVRIITPTSLISATSLRSPGPITRRCFGRGYASTSTPQLHPRQELVVDDRFAVVGTINLDYRSLFLHFEDGVWLCEAPCIRDIRADFEDTLRVCERISLRSRRRFNPLIQLYRNFLRLFAPLM